MHQRLFLFGQVVRVAFARLLPGRSFYESFCDDMCCFPFLSHLLETLHERWSGTMIMDGKKGRPRLESTLSRISSRSWLSWSSLSHCDFTVFFFSLHALLSCLCFLLCLCGGFFRWCWFCWTWFIFWHGMKQRWLNDGQDELDINIVTGMWIKLTQDMLKMTDVDKATCVVDM